MQTDLHLVMTTVPDADLARTLADAWVTAGLVACAQILPGISSVYLWQGELHGDSECLLLLKTPGDRLSALEAALHRDHPYETPEFVVLRADRVSAGYAAWALAQTRPETN